MHILHVHALLLTLLRVLFHFHVHVSTPICWQFTLHLRTSFNISPLKVSTGSSDKLHFFLFFFAFLFSLINVTTRHASISCSFALASLVPKLFCFLLSHSRSVTNTWIFQMFYILKRRCCYTNIRPGSTINHLVPLYSKKMGAMEFLQKNRKNESSTFFNTERDICALRDSERRWWSVSPVRRTDGTADPSRVEKTIRSGSDPVLVGTCIQELHIEIACSSSLPVPVRSYMTLIASPTIHRGIRDGRKARKRQGRQGKWTTEPEDIVHRSRP